MVNINVGPGVSNKIENKKIYEQQKSPEELAKIKHFTELKDAVNIVPKPKLKEIQAKSGEDINNVVKKGTYKIPGAIDISSGVVLNGNNDKGLYSYNIENAQSGYPTLNGKPVFVDNNGKRYTEDGYIFEVKNSI